MVVANLECALTESGQPKPYKYATLRSSPQTVTALDRLQVAVLGNNHISDFGDSGAQETEKTLRAAGIQTVGYGSNLEEAVAPVVVERAGMRLAVVSFCCPTTNGENLATHTSAGVVPLGRELLRRSITAARPHADAVLVYMHWGCEQVHDPVPDQIRLGRQAVEFGADAVVGCHPHVIQSYECYRGRWIFYGLGNFLLGSVETRSVCPDGTIRTETHRQALRNRQSLVVRFSVKPHASDGRLALETVMPVEFAEDYVPRSIPKERLTADIDQLNARLGRYTRAHQAELQRDDEPVFRAEIRNGRLVYFYNAETIGHHDRQPLPRLVLRRLRHLLKK